MQSDTYGGLLEDTDRPRKKFKKKKKAAKDKIKQWELVCNSGHSDCRAVEVTEELND